MATGREAERQWLTFNHGETNNPVSLVWGGPRVGTTTFVTNVLDGLEVPTVYYECDKRGTSRNATDFVARSAAVLDAEPPSIADFREAFEYVDYSFEGGVTVALDEFSDLVAADQEILSEFRTILQEMLPETDIDLILVVSSPSEQSDVLAAVREELGSDLWEQVHLEPLPLHEAASFYPDFESQEILWSYSVLGGRPAYLAQFDDEYNVFDNIEREILSKGTFLHEEPPFRLHQAFRDPAPYAAILAAIAGGAHRSSEVATAVGRDASTLTRYFQTLSDRGLIDKETPILGSDHISRYRISDPFVRFWFRYVAGNRSALERGHTERVTSEVRDTLTDVVYPCYRDICRDALLSPEFSLDCSRVGSWWSQSDRVDIVGLDEETDTLVLGGCGRDTEVLEELEALAPEIRWRERERTVTYTIFTDWVVYRDLQDAVEERDDVRLFGVNEVMEMTDPAA